MDQNKELLAELLLRWEELHEQGQDIPASELAKEHPELTNELARRIQNLKAVSWIDTPIDDDNSDDVYIGDLCKPAESYPHAPRTLAGRYRLGELLAEGGFAKVFKAFDSELERIVAIKVPKASRVASRESFQAEAKRVAGLKHEGIVPVFDVGLEGDTCFIVTEFVEGGSLAEKLWSPNIEVADAVGWTADIGDALEYAHSRGVIHLDIKPANILLANRGRARLTDFGISRSAATRKNWHRRSARCSTCLRSNSRASPLITAPTSTALRSCYSRQSMERHPTRPPSLTCFGRRSFWATSPRGPRTAPSPCDRLSRRR